VPSKRALEASQYALLTPVTAVKRRQLRDPNDSQDLELYTPSQIPDLDKLAAAPVTIPLTPPALLGAWSPLAFPPESQTQLPSE
jgi:hypothetical protein